MGEITMRINVSESKNSKSYYVVKSYRNNGKNTSKIIEVLGTEVSLREKLGEGVDILAWAREYAKELTRREKEGAEPDIIAKYSPQSQIELKEQVSFNGGYLFLQQVYNSLGFPSICSNISSKYKFEYDLNSILSRLVFSRILFPASKKKTNELSQTFIEPPNFELHHIYRSLDVLSNEIDFIQSELYKNSLNLGKRNTGVLYYDCTNFFFETEEAEGIKQYGLSKEHRPNPIVQMGLFVDGDGIPLAFSITEGKKNEQTTLKPLEEKILSDFDLSKFVVCTDAGLSSAANKKFNSKKDRGFITTQSLKKLKAELRNWALSDEGWYIDGDNSPMHNYNGEIIRKRYDISAFTAEEKELYRNKIFYKEKWVIEKGLEQKLIVTYSLKYKNYQEKIRNKQIERALKMLDKNHGKFNKKSNTDPRRFIEELATTTDGEIAERKSLLLNEKVIANEVMYDGFYAVYTNLEDDPNDIIKVNKMRWQIEDCFRTMKSEFKSRPVYLKNDNRIEAHFLTCFITLLIYKLLDKKLAREYSFEELIGTLKGMNFYKLKGNDYIPTYMRTEITDKLHDTFNFRTDFEVLTERNFKKIISKTKN